MHVASQHNHRHASAEQLQHAAGELPGVTTMTTEARAARDESDAADSPRAYLGRLEGLAEAVTQQGLKARLVTPPGRVPSLHVVNPHASALAEDVYARTGSGGSGGPGPSGSPRAMTWPGRRPGSAASWPPATRSCPV